jgi:hypothetical protein
VHKNIFASGALDESITFCSVKPLHNALLFHGRLLSPLVCRRPANHPLKTRKAAGVKDAGQLLFPKSQCGTAKPKHQKRPSKLVLHAGQRLRLRSPVMAGNAPKCNTKLRYDAPPKLRRLSNDPLWGEDLRPQVATIATGAIPRWRC